MSWPTTQSVLPHHLCHKLMTSSNSSLLALFPSLCAICLHDCCFASIISCFVCGAHVHYVRYYGLIQFTGSELPVYAFTMCCMCLCLCNIKLNFWVLWGASAYHWGGPYLLRPSGICQGNISHVRHPLPLSFTTHVDDSPYTDCRVLLRHTELC